MKDGICVLHLVNGEHYAGAERVQEVLLRSLDAARFEVRCVALIPGKFVQHAQRSGLRVEVLRMRGKWDWGIVPRLARYVRLRGVDVIHTHTLRTHLVGRLAGRWGGVPVVSHVHSSLRHEWDNPLKARRNVWLERLTRRWSHHFICVNQALREQLMGEGVPLERISVVYNGLEPGWFALPARRPDKRGFCRRRGVPLEAQLIFMAAWFRPLKGLDLLLEALALLLPTHPQAHLVLVGSFWNSSYEAAVRAQIERLDLAKRVLLLGHQPGEKVKGLLALADVVVLPSRRPEGTPLLLLEAMALGKPVVAAKTGGIPEIVQHEGNGLLFPAGDAQALTACLARILEDPEGATRLGQRARRRIWEHYRSQRMVQQVESIYRALARVDP